RGPAPLPQRPAARGGGPPDRRPAAEERGHAGAAAPSSDHHLVGGGGAVGGMDLVLWALAAVLIGAFGTLVGVGGGILLVPILLFVYPGEPPGRLTAISLAVVLANA